MTLDDGFYHYMKAFGGLPVVGDLPAGLAYWLLLLSPLIAAYWKGGNNIRFGAVPLALIGWVSSIAGELTTTLIFWIIAWICVALSLVKRDPK